MINACKKRLPGAESLSPFILKDFTAPAQKLHPAKPSGHTGQGLLDIRELLPKITSRQVRWVRLEGSLGRERLGSTIPLGCGRRALPTAFTTKWGLSERSVERLFVEARRYVCRAKSVLPSSFHNKPAPRCFSQLQTLLDCIHLTETMDVVAMFPI